MSLIPFPNIPNVLGAPIVKRALGASTSINTVVGKLLNVRNLATKFLNQVFGSPWGIIDKDGITAISPDSVISFEYRNEQRISTHPVDPNSFASYNKVPLPYEIRLVMTCSGNGKMSRDRFLTKLKSMNDSGDLFTITTTDRVYPGLNLVHVDYKRDSKSGVSLITVETWWQEVRVTAVPSVKVTQAPSGTAQDNTGQQSPQTPTVSQLASTSKGAV